MGSAASTMGAGTRLSEADVKQRIGVLYDDEYKREFNKHADGGSVSVEQALAYAKYTGALERGAIFFKNLSQFAKARAGLQAIYDKYFDGRILTIDWRGASLGDEHRQCGASGAPAATLDELYEVAAPARDVFEKILEKALSADAAGVEVTLAPLKVQRHDLL